MPNYLRPAENGLYCVDSTGPVLLCAPGVQSTSLIESVSVPGMVFVPGPGGATGTFEFEALFVDWDGSKTGVVSVIGGTNNPPGNGGTLFASADLFPYVSGDAYPAYSSFAIAPKRWGNATTVDDHRAFIIAGSQRNVGATTCTLAFHNLGYFTNSGSGAGGLANATARGDAAKYWFSLLAGIATEFDGPLRMIGRSASGTNRTMIDFSVNGTLISATGVSLGSVLGNESYVAELRSLDTNDTRLVIKSRRVSAGSSHDSSRTKIQRRVDATDMGFIEFGSPAGIILASIGYDTAAFAAWSTTGSMTTATPGSGDPDISLGGGQLKFPGTQRASSNANTLDDYEEGTWTPTITFSSGSTGITYVSQEGTYTKVGRMVYLGGRIALSNKGSSTGNFELRGLPFTASNTTSRGGGLLWYVLDFNTVNTCVFGVEQNQTFCTGWSMPSGSSNASVIQHTNLNNNSIFHFSLAYEQAA